MPRRKSLGDIHMRTCFLCGTQLSGVAYLHEKGLFCERCRSPQAKKILLSEKCPFCGARLEVVDDELSPLTLALCRKYHRMFNFETTASFVKEIKSLPVPETKTVKIFTNSETFDLEYAPPLLLSTYADALDYRRGITVEREFFITPFWKNTTNLLSFRYEVGPSDLLPLQETRRILFSFDIPWEIPLVNGAWLDQPIPLFNFRHLLRRWGGGFTYEKTNPNLSMMRIVMLYLEGTLKTIFDDEDNLIKALYRRQDILAYSLRELIDWEMAISPSSSWEHHLGYGLSYQVAVAISNYLSNFDLVHTVLQTSPIFDATLRFCLHHSLLSEERASLLLEEVANALGFAPDMKGNWIKDALTIGRNTEVWIKGRRYCIISAHREAMPKADIIAALMFSLANPATRERIATLGPKEIDYLSRLFKPEEVEEAFKIFGKEVKVDAG